MLVKVGHKKDAIANLEQVLKLYKDLEMSQDKIDKIEEYIGYVKNDKL